MNRKIKDFFYSLGKKLVDILPEKLIVFLWLEVGWGIVGLWDSLKRVLKNVKIR